MKEITEKASEFLSEHLYMFYGEPRSICLKVKKDRFTLLQDFFGTHYDLSKFSKENDEEWQEVSVTCVPETLMNWAKVFEEKFYKFIRFNLQNYAFRQDVAG